MLRFRALIRYLGDSSPKEPPAAAPNKRGTLMGDASTLLLFDVDGTLVHGSRAGRTATAYAIRDWAGIPVGPDDIRTAGMTDLLILRDVLDRFGVDGRRLDASAFEGIYLDHLAPALRADPGQICPGVPAFLEALAARGHMRLALGTGNLERAARMKLAAHGLNHYFETGGFGSDAVEREAVIARGIVRAEAHFCLRFERIVVVGDTPNDIAAARANGVHCLAVATGVFGLEPLQAAGPTLAVPDLTATGTLIERLETLMPAPRTPAG